MGYKKTSLNARLKYEKKLRHWSVNAVWDIVQREMSLR